MPTTHDTPQLTVYRNGFINLNGEATRALAAKDAESLLLVAPSRQLPNWLLLPASAGLPGNVTIYPRPDRGNQRLRAYDLATGIFAALPPNRKSVRLVLEPGPAGGWALVAH